MPRNIEGVTKTLTLYGYDSLGNRSQAIDLSFEIDTRAPQLSVLDVLESSRWDAAFTAAGLVSDTNDVALRLTILDPNRQLGADRIGQVGNTWVYSNTRKLGRVGDYVLWVEAEDAAGNVTVAGPYQIERFGMLGIFMPFMAYFWEMSQYEVYLPLVVK